MSALQQYALLLGMVVATIGLVLSLGVIARSISRVREEKAKDVPATSGELSLSPSESVTTRATTATPYCSWPSTWRGPTCTPGRSSTRNWDSSPCSTWACSWLSSSSGSFGAAMDAGFVWLAVVAILNSVLSLAVYLRIVVPMYGRPKGALAPARLVAAVSALALVATVSIGVAAQVLLGWVA